MHCRRGRATCDVWCGNTRASTEQFVKKWHSVRTRRKLRNHQSASSRSHLLSPNPWTIQIFAPIFSASSRLSSFWLAAPNLQGLQTRVFLGMSLAHACVIGPFSWENAWQVLSPPQRDLQRFTSGVPLKALHLARPPHCCPSCVALCPSWAGLCRVELQAWEPLPSYDVLFCPQSSSCLWSLHGEKRTTAPNQKCRLYASRSAARTHCATASCVEKLSARLGLSASLASLLAGARKNEIAKAVLFQNWIGLQKLGNVEDVGGSKA